MKEQEEEREKEIEIERDTNYLMVKDDRKKERERERLGSFNKPESTSVPQRSAMRFYYLTKLPRPISSVGQDQA